MYRASPQMGTYVVCTSTFSKEVLIYHFISNQHPHHEVPTVCGTLLTIPGESGTVSLTDGRCLICKAIGELFIHSVSLRLRHSDLLAARCKQGSQPGI